MMERLRVSWNIYSKAQIQRGKVPVHGYGTILGSHRTLEGKWFLLIGDDNGVIFEQRPETLTYVGPGDLETE